MSFDIEAERKQFFISAGLAQGESPREVMAPILAAVCY